MPNFSEPYDYPGFNLKRGTAVSGDISGKLPGPLHINTIIVVANGGTGRSSLTSHNVLLGNATNPVNFAAPGSSGTVLTSTGTNSDPTFQVLPAGALIKISSQTINNSTFVEFTGLSPSYNTYLVDINGLTPVSNKVEFLMEFGTGVGPTYDITSYNWAVTGFNTNGTNVSGANTNDSSIQLTPGVLNSQLTNNAADSCNIKLYVSNVGSSSLRKTVTGNIAFGNGSFLYTATIGGLWQLTTAVTAIRFFMSTGNISVGNFTLYALN